MTEINKSFSAELVKWFQLSFPKYALAMQNSSHHYDGQNLNPYHMEGSVWTHTLMALTIAEQMQVPPDIMLAILLHDLGKPYVRKAMEEDKKVKFPNHASVSFFRAGEVLTKFAKDAGISPEQFEQSKRRILFIIANHGLLFDHGLDINSEKYINKLQDMLSYTPDLLTMALCDSQGRFNTSPKGNNLDYESYNQLLVNMPKPMAKSQIELVGVPKFYMMMGLPCSGKSTFIRASKEFHNADTFILSRDEIVMEMAGTRNYDLAFKLKGQSEEVDKELEKRIVNVIRAKKDIVLDMTSLSKKRRNKYLSLAIGYQKHALLMYTDLDKIYSRIMDRGLEEKKTIPNFVIDQMMASFTFPFYDQFDRIDWILTE